MSIAAIVVPGVFLVLMAYQPGVLGALQRDRGALGHGEWWRILSPLLVDSDGWIQWLFVSLGFATVGAAVERRIGRWPWVTLFLVGALAGELAGYAWQPYGGGTSIALCGLIGGLTVWQVRRAQPVMLLETIYAVAFAGGLTGVAVLSVLDANAVVESISVVVVGGLTVNILLQVHRRGRDRGVALIAAVLVGLAALALLVCRDNHGAALLAGLAGGWLVTPVRDT